MPHNYDQGDEAEASLDFFTPRAARERLNTNLLKLSEDEGFSAALGIIEPMMHWYEDPDGNFVEQFQTTGFEAREEVLGEAERRWQAATVRDPRLLGSGVDGLHALCIPNPLYGPSGRGTYSIPGRGCDRGTAMREAFLRIAAEFLQAKTESLGSHPLAQFIRRDAPAQVRRSLPPELQSLLVQGTTNPGVWAHVQWIAVMDPAITESPTRGYYVVYLFSANMRWVYLSLNQGMTAVKKEFGSGGMYGVLRNRAAAMPARLTDRDPRFSDADISLESGSEGARAYEAGHALGIEYDLANLPSQNELSKDLTEILRLYLLLRSRGGVLPIEGTDDEEAPDYRDSIKEQRRYRLHRSIERNASAAKKAKQALGYICQGCELNLERIYGPVGHKYIEAHHLTPLSELPEDSPISLDPRRDFAVLCANCHRMMHRKDGPKTVGELRELSRVPVLRQWLHEHP